MAAGSEKDHGRKRSDAVSSGRTHIQNLASSSG
jgi:hypothetical protein